MFLCVENQFYLELNSSIMYLFTEHVLSDSCVYQSQQDRYYSHEDIDQTEYYEGIVDYLISAQEAIMAETKHTFHRNFQAMNHVTTG